jgi:hypothetical protein
MKRTLFAAAAAALTLGSIVTATPAVAEPPADSKVTGTARVLRSTTGRCRTLGPTV